MPSIAAVALSTEGGAPAIVAIDQNADPFADERPLPDHQGHAPDHLPRVRGQSEDVAGLGSGDTAADLWYGRARVKGRHFRPPEVRARGPGRSVIQNDKPQNL